MEKRRSQRSKRRLTCELVIGDQRHAAIVRDASPAGLFVQTRAKPEPDTLVQLVFLAEAGRPELRVEAGVARQRTAPPRLQAKVPSGVGLELLDPPPALQELLAACGVGDLQAGGDDAGDQAVRTFRVRLTLHGKPGARVLTVRSGTAPAARARALTQAGRGWKIAEIQEI